MINSTHDPLLLLAALTPGKTISTSSHQLVEHRSWTTCLWRRYQGENRRQTVSFIYETINQAMEQFENHPTPEQKESLQRALEGVATLTVTYESDQALTEEIRFFCDSNLLTLKNIWDNHLLGQILSEKKNIHPIASQSSPPSHSGHTGESERSCDPAVAFTLETKMVI